MKKFPLLLLALIIGSLISAQSLTSISPNSGTQGNNSLAVTISGIGTSFNQGSSTYITFNQGSSTYISGYNTVVNSATSLTTYIDIPFSANTGLYDLNVYDGTNNLNLYSSFTVLAGPVPQITYVDTNYASPGTTLDVVISGLNTNFSSGSNTSVWFSQGYSTLYPNFVTVTDSVSLIANFTIPQGYPAGFYDVSVYDYQDNTIDLPYGFFISDTSIGILSVTSDSTVYTLGNDSIVLVITGSGTHFAVQGDTTIVWLGQVHRSEVPNIFPISTHVISNTQISATFRLPAGISSGYYDVFTFNNIDGELTKEKALDFMPSGITPTNADNIKVYPNPAIDKIYINIGSAGIANITMTSVSGALVMQKTGAGDSQEELNVSGLDAGVYILSITDRAGGTSYKKILIGQ